MKYIKYSSPTWFSVYMWYLFNTTSVSGSVSATWFLVPSTSIRHFMTATNLFIHIKSQYLTTKCFKLHLELQSILQIVSGNVLQMQCTRLILKWYLTRYFQIHVLLFHKFIQNHWKTSQANRALNKINICCKWGCCLALYCMSIIKIEVSFSRLVATSCRLFWSMIDSRLVATSRIRKIIEQLVIRLVV